MQISRVKTNETMEQYRPQSRMRKLEEKSSELEAKIKAAKAKKQALLEGKLKKQVDTIRKRQYTRDLKVMRLDRIEVRQTWSTFFAIVGVCTASLYAIPHRKQLHERAGHLVRGLCVISQALGKLMQPVRALRRKSAVGKLGVLGVYAKLWMGSRKRKQQNIIVECLEHGITQALLMKLMAEWHFKLVRIQRGMRWLLLWKRIRYRQLLRRWSAYESSAKLVKIPLEVKLIYLRQHVRKQLQSHIIQVREWKQDCEQERKAYEESFYRIRADLLLSGLKRGLTMVLPMRPAFDPVVKRRDFEVMHDVADRARLRWDWMLLRSNASLRVKYSKP
jgi:hypothetical protein